MKVWITILSLMLGVLSVSAQNLLGIDGEESTAIGIYIKDIKSGEVLVDKNSSMALTPASVMKAVTTASVVTSFGTDSCFTTLIELEGRRDDNLPALWHGNILVHAVGDPTVESEHFPKNRGLCDSIAARLREMGIAKIDGGIRVVDNMLDQGPVWQWEIEDVAWAYGAGFHGLNWRDNKALLTPASETTIPEVPDLNIIIKKGDNDVLRGIGSTDLIAYARNPEDEKWKVSISVPNPTAVFINELEWTLARAGISTGEYKSTDGSATTLYVHRSPKFGDIMRSTMMRSDNLFAEALLRTLASHSSRTDAIRAEKNLWNTHGINASHTIINDGSGLTRANRISARFVSDILEWMSKSDQAAHYASFFPRAGIEGTLKSFLVDSPLRGSIAMKTGSVSAVQCYAGYKLDINGNPTHTIVILVNGFFCPRSDVRHGAERLLTKIFLNE